MNYYILYREIHVHRYKGKARPRTQTRVKKVAISGNLKSYSRGTFLTRFGKRVHRIKFSYINPIPEGTGQNRRVKKMKVDKIVEIPSGASNIRITRKKPRNVMR
jgi:hypothetical protein